MSDAPFVAGAAGAALGAWFAWDTSVLLGATLVVVALALRLGVLLPAGLLIATAGVAAGQLTALSVAEDRSIDGVMSLVDDPEWRSGGLVFAVADPDTGERWQAWARGAPAYALTDASVGERWHITGEAKAAEEASVRFLWPRHLVGRIEVASAVKVSDGSAPYRIANAVRSLIERSGESLSERDQALLAGFVYGDDRGQLPEVQHDFRATAMTHLLAVSGSNVVFVLFLAAPLLLRLSMWGRFVAVVVILFEFALLTRAEPSVLRASVMATLAVGAQAMGRNVSVPRLLSLAVIVLLLVDPLLVRSAGFQLSVAASAGIVLLAGPIARNLVGPTWLRLGVSVTIAAQAGVMGVQLWLFGSLPLVSVPANVLAVPMAGPAMVWGLVAGIFGGLVGEPIATLAHLPTRLMVGWVAEVARIGAALGWPQIEPDEVLWMLLAVLGCVAALRFAAREARGARALVIVAGALAVWLAASLGRPALPTDDALTALGVDGNTVVIVDRPSPTWALDTLAASGVDDIDVLIAKSSSRGGVAAVRAISRRHEVAETWVAAGFPAEPGVRRRLIGEPVTLAGSSSDEPCLVVTPRGDRLDVER